MLSQFRATLPLKQLYNFPKPAHKGRLGIHELIEGAPEIKRMIKKSATSENLFEQAMKEEMTTLKQDGILKSFKVVTDITEVRRVCIN